jgi:hypothetical protein
MAPPPPWLAALLFLLLPALLPAVGSVSGAAAAGIFRVRRKLPAGVGGDTGANISALRAHDGRRHGRLLAAADLPLGGLGLPTDTGYVPALSVASFFVLGDFPVGCLIWLWGLLGRSGRAQALLHGDQARDAAQALLRPGRHWQRHPVG